MIDFWKPLKPIKPKKKVKVPIKMKPFDLRIKPVTKKKNMNYPQAKRKFNLNPYGDVDKDGVKNWIDCKPFNPKKHGKYTQNLPRKEAARILRRAGRTFDSLRKDKADLYRTFGREGIRDLVKTGEIKSRGNSPISFSRGPFGQTLGSAPHVTVRVSTKDKIPMSTRQYDKDDVYKGEQEVVSFYPIQEDRIRAIYLPKRYNVKDNNLEYLRKRKKDMEKKDIKSRTFYGADKGELTGQELRELRELSSEPILIYEEVDRIKKYAKEKGIPIIISDEGTQVLQKPKKGTLKTIEDYEEAQPEVLQDIDDIEEEIKEYEEE